MQNLPDAIKQRPITQLKLPGTHDSAAYDLKISVTPPMELTPMMDWAREVIQEQPAAESILRGLTLTQSLNIFEQLEQGIRAFDFRILYSSQTGSLFLSHSFATTPLSSVLTQIREFSSQHPSEILVVQMQDDTEHVQQTTPYNHIAVSMVRSVLGTLLIPATPNLNLNSTMTLQSLVNAGQRILFSFMSHLNKSYSDIWPGSIITNHWPNKQDVNASIAMIKTYREELQIPKNKSLNLVFFTVTPTQDSIAAGALGEALGCGTPYTLYEWAQQMNAASASFLNQSQKNFSGVNIVSVDNPSDAYIEQIIEWNLY